jgi:uncharacterized protein (DUF2267 family)
VAHLQDLAAGRSLPQSVETARSIARRRLAVKRPDTSKMRPKCWIGRALHIAETTGETRDSESQHAWRHLVGKTSQRLRDGGGIMSATGLDVFDKSLQTTNVWLKEICEEIGPDRQIAWHVLGSTLRALRDRLQPELAAHLGAELPLVVRGAYYDRYRPAEQPRLTRSREEFVKTLIPICRTFARSIPTRPHNACSAFSITTFRRVRSTRCEMRCRRMFGSCGRRVMVRRLPASSRAERRAGCSINDTGDAQT